MFKQITNLQGDEIYLIVSLWIFIIFFVAVGFMLFFMKKEHIQYMKKMPFDEPEQEIDYSSEEQQKS